MAKRVRFEGEFHPGDELSDPDEAAVVEDEIEQTQEPEDRQNVDLTAADVVAAQTLAQLSLIDDMLVRSPTSLAVPRAPNTGASSAKPAHPLEEVCKFELADTPILDVRHSFATRETRAFFHSER